MTETMKDDGSFRREERGSIPTEQTEGPVVGWRPIETAPYTFTTIFGGGEFDKWLDWSLLGRFDEHGFVAWVGGMDAGEWLYRDDVRCCGEAEPPTHWMPLPAPPENPNG